MKHSYLNDHISIPEYWSAYVTQDWDIEKVTKGPCPFHGEKHGNSLSYDPVKGYISCFGRCKMLAGDVVSLHQLNYKISTREEAEESLARLRGITPDKKICFEPREIHVNQKDIDYRIAYGKAVALAKTPDDWVALDYMMSQFPPSTEDLNLFINQRSVVSNELLDR